MDRSIRSFSPTASRTPISTGTGTTTSDYGPTSAIPKCRPRSPSACRRPASLRRSRRPISRSIARGCRRRHSCPSRGASNSGGAMSAKNILLICGTVNQTRAMMAIGNELADHHCYYTPFYCDGHLLRASQRGQLDFTVLAGPLRERSIALMRSADVPIDDRGERREYDLIVTCTDLILQDNIEGRRIVLVQEGLTEREGFLFWLVKHLGVPRGFAITAAFGASDGSEVFCVASPGARDLFRAKGVRDEKMVVTGIPNFDNVVAYLNNDFPHRDFVLICTSTARE